MIILLISNFLTGAVWAGGSIAWIDVRNRVRQSDPKLINRIEEVFSVNRVGGATRLGHQFGERVGERIPPYEFEAVRKSTGEFYRLVIDQSDDFEFTGRYKFTWQVFTRKKATGQGAIVTP